MAPWRPPALLSLAFALGACGQPHRIAAVQDQDLLAATLTEPRYDRAWRRVVDYGTVDPKLYGFDGSSGGPHNNATFDADVVEVSGRRFLVVTRQLDAVHTSLSWLEVGKGQPARAIDERIALPPTLRKLAFDVEPVSGGFVLLHADGARVVERRARLTADGLEFLPPRTFTASEPVLAVQLTRTDDRLHALWTTCDATGNTTAYYCSASLADQAWSGARSLGGRGCYAAARMAAGDRDLYVAWCDNRWRWRENWFTGYVNQGKVCVVASRDGGQTFTQPIVINDPDDFGDVALAVDLVVGRGGVLVCWRKPRPSEASGYHLWGVAAVDVGLRRMHHSQDVGGDADVCR
jgi:hypothetical protein